MATGSFRALRAQKIADGTNRLHSTGWDDAGSGAAEYARLATNAAPLPAGGEGIWWSRDEDGNVWYLDELNPTDAMFGGDMVQAQGYYEHFHRPIHIVGAVTISVTINARSLDLVGRGGSISGFDGTGYLCSGNIRLSGDLTIRGFGDGTEDQKDNHDASFIRIASGSRIDRVVVGEGVRFEDCRCGVLAGDPANDFKPDVSITIGTVTVNGVESDGCPNVFMFRCIVRYSYVTSCVFENCVGASRCVGPVYFYVDGLPSGSPAYEEMIAHYLAGCKFSNIVQRTLTGDSTTGNNYECHGYMAYGRSIHSIGNTFLDITGVNYDCEAIYTKGRYVSSTDDVFINAGTDEGVINIKGSSPLSTTSASSPGGGASIKGAFILFDRYSYDNAGTIVTFSQCRAIHLEVPYMTTIEGCTFIGCKGDADIVVDGYRDSDVVNPNIGVRIINNTSYQSRAGGFVQLRGAFQEMDLSGTKALDVRTSGQNYELVSLISLAGAGINIRNLNASGMTLQMNNNNLADHTVTMIRFDNENYDIDGLYMNRNIWDVVAPGATLFAVEGNSQTGDPKGKVDFVEMKDWTFKQSFPGNFLSVNGGAHFRTADIDVVVPQETTNNDLSPIAGIRLANGASCRASIEADGFSTTAPANAIHQPLVTSLFYCDDDGNASRIAAQTVPEIGSAKTASVSVMLDANGNLIRWRVNGDDGETWRWKVRIKMIVGHPQRM